ncbi:MAG: hypothetical protein ABFS86_01555 [Planctomycetota bacterium]
MREPEKMTGLRLWGTLSLATAVGVGLILLVAHLGGSTGFYVVVVLTFPVLESIGALYRRLVGEKAKPAWFWWSLACGVILFLVAYGKDQGWLGPAA